jgi:hypothetical protein
MMLMRGSPFYLSIFAFAAGFALFDFSFPPPFAQGVGSKEARNAKKRMNFCGKSLFPPAGARVIMAL